MDTAPDFRAQLFARIRCADAAVADAVARRLRFEFPASAPALDGDPPAARPGELTEQNERWMPLGGPDFSPLRLADVQMHAFRLERLYGARIKSAAPANPNNSAPPPLRINMGYARPDQIVIAEMCEKPGRILIGGEPPAAPVFAEILLVRDPAGDWRPLAPDSRAAGFSPATFDFLTGLAAQVTPEKNPAPAS